MTQPDTSGRERLLGLLDKIISEEQDFKITMRNEIAHNDDLIGDIQAAVESDGMADELERIRLSHETMFEIHRRFTSEHEMIVQRCLAVSGQVGAGLLNETEIALEIERLQNELRRIKQEHSSVQKESRQILLAQSQSFKNLDRSV